MCVQGGNRHWIVSSSIIKNIAIRKSAWSLNTFLCTTVTKIKSEKVGNFIGSAYFSALLLVTTKTLCSLLTSLQTIMVKKWVSILPGFVSTQVGLWFQQFQESSYSFTRCASFSTNIKKVKSIQLTARGIAFTL